MVSKFLLIYIGIVAGIGMILVWYIRRRIVETEAMRRNRVRKVRTFEAVVTSTPIDASEKTAKEAAIESVENRFSLIRKLSFYTFIFIWIIALIFPFLNEIPASFVSILIAASGVIIGVAARPFIENLISGIVISFSKMFRIGDTVIIDNNYGTIEDITLTHTVLKIWKRRRYIIPNGRMLSKELINCTINDSFQWSHVEFFVSYDADLETVKKLAVDAAVKSTYYVDYEKPRFWVMAMEEKGYKCWIAAWVNSPVYAWELANDIRTELIKQFREKGIKTHKFEVETPAFNENAVKDNGS